MNNEAATTVAELEHAKENGDVRVRIILGDNEEQIQRIANVLRGYTQNLCSVSLVGCDVPNGNGTGWEIPNIRPVLAVIASLSRIVHVQFENSSVHGWTLKASELTTFLQRTRLRLETLDFTAVRVEGTRLELEALDRAIGGLVCLRGCCLQNNFLLWIQDDKEIYPLDDMLQGISKLPLLQEVYIDLDHWNDEAHQKQLTSSSQTLRAILSSNSIQDFFLGKLDPTHPAIQDIAAALAAPPSANHIRFLSLQFKPQPINNKTVDTATTSMETEVETISANNNNDNNNNNKKVTSKKSPLARSLQCLARALRVNTSLQELRLSFSCSDNSKCPKLDPFLVQVAQELSQNSNTGLTKLEVVSPCNYGVAVEQAFVKLLRTNYTLTELEFYSNLGDKYVSLDGSHRTEMHLYLSLNSEGRQDLMQTYERKPWVDALVASSHSLDALFYYLLINPWLMSQDHTMDSRPNNNRKRNLLEVSSSSSSPLENDNSARKKMRRLEEEIERLQLENDALKRQQQQQQQVEEDEPYSFGCVIM